MEGITDERREELTELIDALRRERIDTGHRNEGWGALGEAVEVLKRKRGVCHAKHYKLAKEGVPCSYCGSKVRDRSYTRGSPEVYEAVCRVVCTGCDFEDERDVS